MAFPGIAYSYIGVESIIMAAYEGIIDDRKKRHNLQYASRIAMIMVLIPYLLFTCFTAYVVPWDDANIMPVYPHQYGHPRESSDPIIPSNNLVIIAMNLYGKSRASISGVNGLFIFCVLSGANSALYIASRAWWGVARDAVGRGTIKRHFKWTYGVWDQTHVPLVALIFSAGLFSSWVPALLFIDPVTAKDVGTPHHP